MDNAKPVERVTSFVVEGLRTGSLTPGQKLPTEREFAEHLGISRAAVREALAALEMERRIIRHVGRGTFLTHHAHHASGEARSGIHPVPPRVRHGLEASPSQLLEARNALEPQLVELAVLNAMGTDMTRMREACSRSAAAMSAAEFEECDGAFHRAIALATHNPLLIAAYDLISSARQNAEWRKLKEHRFQNRPERRAEVLHEHDVLMRRIEGRDPAGARHAMLHHLSGVRANLFGQ